MSEGVFTIRAMGRVVDLAEWRRRGADRGAPTAGEEEPASGEAGTRGEVLSFLPEAEPDRDLARLERAVERLGALVGADPGRRFPPEVETELLAIIGELHLELVPEAAARAERLVSHLSQARRRG
jgi:hypothetical protein